MNNPYPHFKTNASSVWPIAGRSYDIPRVLKLERLVGVGITDEVIVETLNEYLSEVGIDKELIIVDPYFYSSNDENYPKLVVDVLDFYLDTIETITVITNTKVAAKRAVEYALRVKCSNIVIKHRTTGNWHDRFWISNNRSAGIITGTSLNGFGRRYTLVDSLVQEDVHDIINALKEEKLID